ncbi:hypothetical protein DM01DRAFT_1379671 [Hesseltinella vesiculosa]|uniref:histone acetyltransferase n=1 Tax=Hesseltinella vesiculosa TaxID=101127 RepID=A0A1X2GYP5_9FUNG|nr:hypothetical protein DM01DRAFT_1379671 [Hesseltinella vesiculosa]
MDFSSDEKARLLAPYLPCDHCACERWRSLEADEEKCHCDHTLLDHVDQWEDSDRRLKLAQRINDIKKEKGKENDVDYTDDLIQSLQKQILENNSTEGFLSEASSLSSIDGASSSDDRDMKREREDTEESEAKRQKLDEDKDTNGELLNQETLEANGVFDMQGTLDEDGALKLLEDSGEEKKENPAMVEEREGIIEIQVVENDNTHKNMILLTGLKNIFQKQLPMMPKEYIARLVYDRNHRSIALIRKPLKVIGGICYRPFNDQEFAEIVFCAIASTEQVKGYGSHLMNHLKDYVMNHTPIQHFLTYADNYATGYFRKQGFTTEISLDRRKWVGFIKDYEGGTIMQCTVVPKMNYLQAQKILAIQKRAVYEKTKEYSTSHIVFPGLDMPANEDGKRSIDPLKVPGVRESGWTLEMDMLSNRPRHPPHYNQMRHLVSELQSHASCWPFIEPVNADEVTDYYEVITDPMDLTTLEQNVEGDVYGTMEEFVTDVQKIFDNCRTYNAEGTNYAKCATRLERYFNERLQVWTDAH